MSPVPFDRRDGEIWIDGKFVDWKDASIHVLTHCLHYASSVFEGERAYGGAVFKLREHTERLIRSGRILGFEIPYAVEAIERATSELLVRQGIGDAYIRPIAFRGSEMMSIASPRSTVHLVIACWPWPNDFDIDERMAGIRMTLADYCRPDPRTAPFKSKASGLYMICTLSKHEALAKGYDDALMLDWRGHVAEATGANVFFVRGGALVTPSADCFLDGITRRTIIALAGRRGIAVEERAIMPDELADMDECFLCGTAAEIVPVREIADWRFRPGETTRQLIADYHGEVQPRRIAAE